jgi:isopenicillin-N N-acyltransferase like protein
VETFPFIHVSGSAVERGRKIGQLAKKQIIHNINSYKQIFMDLAGVSWESATTRAADYIPWIERYDKEIMDEIKGISEGSDQNLLDIVALNARSEIILNTDGCTSLAVVPPVTRNGDTLIGQNWDWLDKIKPGVIILEIEQSPRPTILMTTEAGIVGKIGMNSEGLGVCLNLLGTADRAMGVPIHIVLRGILNSKSLSQAVGQVGRLARGTSANYLIAHKEGEALNIEATPHDYDVLYPADGMLTHTNHFIGARKVNIQDTARIKFPDTHLRQGRANKLLLAQNESADAQVFKNILTDHVGYPDGICRHGELFPPDLGRPVAGNTVFSIIMNLSQGVMELTTGQPCSSPYKIYRFTTNRQIEPLFMPKGGA